MKNNSVIRTAKAEKANSSIMGWRDKKKEALRISILEAASQMVVDGGVESLSMRKVAEQTGASTMVVYTVFGSKEGLLEALWAEGFRRLWELEEDSLKVADPLERLRSLGQAYRRNAINNSAFYKLVFGGRLANMLREREEAKGADDDSIRTFSVLIDTVAACQRSKQMTASISAAEIAAMFWSSAHGSVSLELNGMLWKWAEPEKIYTQNIDALIEGLNFAK